MVFGAMTEFAVRLHSLPSEQPHAPRHTEAKQLIRAYSAQWLLNAEVLPEAASPTPHGEACLQLKPLALKLSRSPCEKIPVI